MYRWLWLMVCGVLILVRCSDAVKNPSKKSQAHKDTLRVEFPSHFPPAPIPSDNALTAERIELGKELFFSPVFSGDGKTSCASCHKPELAFADTVTLSPGVNGRLGFRNSPSLVNIAWHPAFMLDGGVPTLELQVL